MKIWLPCTLFKSLSFFPNDRISTGSYIFHMLLNALFLRGGCNDDARRNVIYDVQAIPNPSILSNEFRMRRSSSEL
jgi:hypothetical protein